MGVFAEFSPRELFDVEHVDVKDGIIHSARLPRSRLYLWRDSEQKRDLILFLGEAQPPLGKRSFCRGLVDMARQLGAERILTIAAMASVLLLATTLSVMLIGILLPFSPIGPALGLTALPPLYRPYLALTLLSYVGLAQAVKA